MISASEMRSSLASACARPNLPVILGSSSRRAAVSPSKVCANRSDSCSAPESMKPQVQCSLSGRPESLRSRRHTLSDLLMCSTALYLTQYQAAEIVLAEEKGKKEVAGGVEKEQSVFEGLKSLFDPNETTKSGKKLPKAYLKSARGVVTKLRDSFNGDSKNETEFRRNADSAKEAIRDYVSNWRGSEEVASEESYQAIEKALRVLGEFYSKQGPRATLPEDVRAWVLESLQTADDNL